MCALQARSDHFKEASEAYRVLSDTATRKHYDSSHGIAHQAPHRSSALNKYQSWQQHQPPGASTYGAGRAAHDSSQQQQQQQREHQRAQNWAHVHGFTHTTVRQDNTFVIV
jgi:DnaJ-class molecular chaperone